MTAADEPNALRVDALDPNDLLLIQQSSPDVYKDLMKEKKKDQRHRRWHHTLPTIYPLIGMLSGLIALGILTWVALAFVDQGATAEGVTIITSGAASIVVVFVTGRLATKD
ncbi:hypothetical protein Q5762_14140 [Streptomyces sp. P9(2023)]|uniref:hypothetical protein n=1 Tax=Streptomyces sp. P9(2023) TaxID=3064394 RepID=UPI0028F41182|nr:hypothetical protein [Streptomyces sp. P9(2023)]MDT9689456.1 hypothetical protein [Streptomyces sp. P9(2023)]